MPQTMASYLNADYEDRQHIPPAQMMKIVFNDINNASSLDEVKELFPDEPLFEKLHSADNKKHREGLLAEINLMREPGKTLFKNGKDDLGLYILKKIYLEGKMRKEINEDFKKDISVHYNGLSDIDYKTIANFGIKFPNHPFWKSFLATREDFPYVPVKRKDAEFHATDKAKRERTLADVRKNDTPQEPKFDIKEHEIKKITESIIEGHGDINSVQKVLKKKGIKKDNEKGNFVSQYLGPIMNITLDRIHASDEMRTYFSDYESLNAGQKRKFKDYWKEHTNIAELQSLIMSDTIKLFFMTYGADGNNEEFRELVEYANSIKPAREERIRKHNELQEEYEKALGIFEEEQTAPAESITTKETKPSVEDFEKKKEEWAQKYNMKEYQLTDAEGNTYNISINLKDGFNTYIHSQFDNYLPKAYINKYSLFFAKHPKADEKYKISLIMKSSDQMNEDWEKLFLSDEQIINTGKSISSEFIEKYPQEARAVMESIAKPAATPNDNGVIIARLYEETPFSIMNALYKFEQATLQAGQDNILLDRLRKTMDQDYIHYLQPLTKNESIRISKKIIDELANYDGSSLSNAGYKRPDGVEEYITALSMYYNDLSDKEKRKLNYKIQYYMQNQYGGSVRSIIEENFSPMAKKAKIENFLIDFIRSNSQEFVKMVCSNPKCLFYLHVNRNILNPDNK